MARITVEDCLEHVDNRFALVILAAERARMLSKRATDERTKQMRIVVFYGIGLLLILVAIPWPFSPLAQRPYLP